MRFRQLSPLLVLAALFACKSEHAKPAGAASAGVTEEAPAAPAEKKPDLAARAETLAHELLILDGHIDLPARLIEGRDAQGKLTHDPGTTIADGDFDHTRAAKGGLDAAFMSIYVPARLQEPGDHKGPKAHAEALIDIIEEVVEANPGKFAHASSTAEVREAFKKGVVALPMGMENGAPIEGDLANVAHFHKRGIRYITLTHSKDNHICDSSYDDRHTHGGLSAFGKKVVAEMNRLGIIIDVSHISDQTFEQVMALSKAPVVASHSSCRHFTPGWERNMSDDMIKTLAKNDGVIQINFGSSFIDEKSWGHGKIRRTHLRKVYADKKLEWNDDEAKAIRKAYDEANPFPKAPVERVADHIDHVIELVGENHVGLGSDWDGVGDTLPIGLEDPSKLPNLIRVLLERGHSEATIAKILGENVMRVWTAVEAHAAQN